MTKEKHIPQRRCIACGTVCPKRELIRFAKQADGTYRMDENGCAKGRGVYLCREEACREKAAKQKRYTLSWGCAQGQEA